MRSQTVGRKQDEVVRKMMRPKGRKLRNEELIYQILVA